MKRSRQIPLLTITLVMSTLLTACGGRTPGVGMVTDPTVAAPATDPSLAAPIDPNAGYPVTDPNAGYPVTDPNAGYQQPVSTMPMDMGAGLANAPAGSFKIPQGNVLYGWRARGITVSGGTIYIAAVDNEGLTKNGTVLSMDSTAGKNGKNLASSLLGLSAKLNSTLQGVAVAGGNLYAIDSTAGLFSVRTSGGEVKSLKGNGGQDIAGSNYGIFVAANGMLEKGDMTGTARAPMMPQIMAAGGIGSDSRGNVFFANGPRVAVIDTNGMPRDVVTQGVVTPIDVAADGRNGDIYVLEGPEVKRFSMQGQMTGKFNHGATQATSIAVDESGNVFVSDYGSSSSDSKVLKFAAVGAQAVNGGAMGYPQTGYPQTGYAQQPAYGQQTGYTGYNAQTAQQAYPQQAYNAQTAQRAAYPQQQVYPQQAAYPQTQTQGRQY